MKTVNFAKLISCVNAEEEQFTNQCIWPHVETVDVHNPGTTEVNGSASSDASSDVIIEEVIFHTNYNHHHQINFAHGSHHSS